MKHIFLILTFLILCKLLLAPEIKAFYIEKAKGIDPYKCIIKAIGAVESQGDIYAYNPIEKATGFLQIRPIRLRDFNHRTGKHYKMKNLYDPAISTEIFLYYAKKFYCLDYHSMALEWNCQSEKYWNKVKGQLI